MRRTNRQHFEALARAQGKLPKASKQMTSQRQTLNAITATNRMSGRDDAAILAGDEFTLVLPTATLATNNTLLRVGDLGADSYKKNWGKRLADVRLLHMPLWKKWESVVSYPLVLDAVYCVPHHAAMDRDGLVGALKYVIDAVRTSGLIHDDSPRYLSQVLPVQLTGHQSGLFLKLRPSPGPYGHTDLGLVEQAYRPLSTDSVDNSVGNDHNPRPHHCHS